VKLKRKINLTKEQTNKTIKRMMIKLKKTITCTNWNWMVKLKTNLNFIKKNLEQKIEIKWIRIKFEISINKKTSLNFYMIMQFLEGGERSGRRRKWPLTLHCHLNTVTCCSTRKISEGTPSYTMKREFWMSRGVAYTVWRVRAPSTRWCILCTCQLIYIYILYLLKY
jgi:hypothetical protein